MAALKVRKECLESEVHFTHNNVQLKVKLSEATPEQLKLLKELEVDVFEKPAKDDK